MKGTSTPRRTRPYRLALGLLGSATATAIALPLSTTPASATATPFHRDTGPTVVASGLDNPRGLVVSHGTLYFAQAGKGGDGPCVETPEGGRNCLGGTGEVSRLRLHTAYPAEVRAVATGLPSLGEQDTGNSAIGPSDVTIDKHGQVWVTIGLGGAPAVRNVALGNTRLSRQLATVGVVKHGSYRVRADLGAFEQTHNPDGTVGPDTNPQSLISTRKGVLVADAGGNDILSVRAMGKISTRFVLPTKPAVPNPFDPNAPAIEPQAIPDSIVRGPDGAYYFGELTGFPFVPGTAAVWRWVPGHAPTVYADGFTNIIDLSFTCNGNLLVLEIAKDGLTSPNGPIGALIEVSKRTGARSTVPTGDLFAPGGITVDGKDVYLSDNSILAGQGRILRVRVGN
jgi:hypothetical protein